MFRKLSFVLICFLLALNFACGTSETANTNQLTNSIDQTNLPPGLSTSPVNINGASIPGIPDAANANVLQKGTTPTPGIPDPSTNRKNSDAERNTADSRHSRRGNAQKTNEHDSQRKRCESAAARNFAEQYG